MLVAGATGAVGRRIVPLLLARGDRVVGLTRSAARAGVLRAAGVEPVVVDVVDGKAVTAAVRAARPDVVMHQLTDLAGQRPRGQRPAADGRHPQPGRRGARRRNPAHRGPEHRVRLRDGPDPATEDVPLRGAPGRGTGAGVRGGRAAGVGGPALRPVLRPGHLVLPGGAMADRARAGAWSPTRASRASSTSTTPPRRRSPLAWPCGPVNICDDEPAAGPTGSRLLRRGRRAATPRAGRQRPVGAGRGQRPRPRAGLAPGRPVVAGAPRLRGGRDAHVALARGRRLMEETDQTFARPTPASANSHRAFLQSREVGTFRRFCARPASAWNGGG